MSDLFEQLETWGSTCWEPGCEWESPERFTRSEAMTDSEQHRELHNSEGTY